jgi:hypothetical protein
MNQGSNPPQGQQQSVKSFFGSLLTKAQSVAAKVQQAVPQQLFRTEPPEVQANYAWQHVRDYYQNLREKDRVRQMREPLPQEIIAQIKKLTDLLVAEAENEATRDERKVFAFFREAHVISALCDVCVRDVPLGSCTYILLALKMIVEHAPFEFLAVGSTSKPLSDAIAHLVNHPDMRDAYAEALVLLLLDVALRIKEHSQLISLFTREDLRNRSAFPLFTGALQYLATAKSTVREAAERTILAIAGLPEPKVSEFIVLQTDLFDLLIEQLADAYDELERRGFELNLARNEGARKEFFSKFSFVERLLQTGSPFLVENLMSRLEIAIGSRILKEELFFSRSHDNADQKSVDLLENGLIFLRDLVLSISSSSLMEVIVNAIFVHKKERALVLYECFFSPFHSVALASLQLIDAILSRNHSYAFWALVGQYVLPCSFMTVDEHVSKPYSLDNLARWDAAFPDVFQGQFDDVGSYFDDARVKIMANVQAFQLTDEDPDASQTAGSAQGYENVASGRADSSSQFRLLPEEYHMLRTSDNHVECPLLSFLFRKLERFLESPTEINVFVTGILAQLAMTPCPPLLAYLLSSDVPLSPSVPSLGKSVRFVACEITNDARFSKLQQTLPRIYAKLGIPSRFSGGRGPVTDEQLPQEPSSPGTPLTNPEFDIAVAVFLEFRRELLAILGAWKDVLSWSRKLHDHTARLVSDVGTDLLQDFNDSLKLDSPEVSASSPSLSADLTVI